MVKVSWARAVSGANPMTETANAIDNNEKQVGCMGRYKSNSRAIGDSDHSNTVNNFKLLGSVLASRTLVHWD